VRAAVVVIVAFLGMELVSYATHRWVMHGPGMGWHRSHHRPAEGRFERNDLFPLCFSAVGVALFALATVGPAVRTLFWVGVGVTAYGALYMVVHDVCIHRRLPVPIPSSRYLAWVRDAHRVHHVTGGEPYGMLLPLVPGSSARRAARTSPAVLDRTAREASTRPARSRL
jgi:beta-carotene 3-hydroxylase